MAGEVAETMTTKQSFQHAIQQAKLGKRVNYTDMALLLRAAMISDGHEIDEEEALYIVQKALPRLLAT